MGVFIGECDLGRGVFAKRSFELGEVIFRFSGQLITSEETAAKGARSMDTLQIAPRLYLDLDSPGVFLNHSCEPNAAVSRDIFLVALRRIEPGEEIRFDYSTTMSEDPDTMICDCKALQCRRLVGDFCHLPISLRFQYLEKGIVQSFIVHALRSRVPETV